MYREGGDQVNNQKHLSVTKKTMFLTSVKANPGACIRLGDNLEASNRLQIGSVAAFETSEDIRDPAGRADTGVQSIAA
jgi:hypothetical protein